MLNRMRSERQYTADEFLDFIDKEENKNNRYELIDGHIYLMSSPSLEHQRIVGFIYSELRSFLKGKSCEAFVSPLDVFLFDTSLFSVNDSMNVYQPDVFVVCDKNKLTAKGVQGIPDIIIEIVSRSSSTVDYVYKFNNYMRFGVKEYWIVNPTTRQITVYLNNVNKEEMKVYNYTFNDVVKVSLFEGLYIDFKELGNDL